MNVGTLALYGDVNNINASLIYFERKFTFKDLHKKYIRKSFAKNHGLIGENYIDVEFLDDSEYVSNDENSDDAVDDTDLGDQTYECPFCGSMMWYGERIDKHRQTSMPKFGLCCMSGKVQLPKIRDVPHSLNNLVFGTDRRSKHFQENVRSYNMMFSFTSLGGKVQTSINNGSGPYTFLLHGQNYHLLGSLLPEEGTRPKFAQLYIFDTENEIQNRIDAVRSGNQSNNLDPAIVASLKDMIDGNNVLAQHYRAVRDRFSNDGHQGVKLRLVKSRSTDGMTYNLPNASEIAGLIVGDFDTQEGVRDIVVETRSNKLQRISELHPLYLPLQYPLLFPYGEDGYRDDISLRESSFADNRKRRKVESQRLNFIRFNQDQLRVDMYKGIEENFFKGDTEGKNVGQRIIIPWSFTAGPRPEDRPDILCRVFKMKLDSMMTEIKKGRIFGRIRAYVCTIEFQKRGLPHAHILLWLHNDDKPKNPEEIDRIICAEIPDEENDRKMYKLVEKYMIHGPCGQANLKSPCMKDRVCTKRFPKSFVQRTESDADGFTVYRRREDGRTVTKKKTTLDNGFVVPYNRILLSKYRAHINIDLCNQKKSIKYLFKYVNKGHDRVTAAFYETRNTDGGAEIHDEIKMYYDCIYLSACEAMWRLFNFDIHYRDPSVIRLSFHLPDHQPIVFNENQSLQTVLDRPSAKQTMFMAWFEANKNYPHARDLRYGDFPQQFVYKEDSRTWAPRKKGFSIGRIANVPPGKGEDYYLRLLLNIQRGCTCYEDIRKVFDIVYPTFRDACYVLGLLDDDKEYIDAIKEVNTWASGDYIRRLFAVMLLSNSLSRPEHVWQSCWLDLTEGIAYKQRLHKNPDLHISDESLKNYTLTKIEKILQSNDKSLQNYAPMPVPIEYSSEDTKNILVLDELDYDRFEMGRELQQCLASITDEQRKVYDVVMDAVTNDSGGMFFLYGHGGTGKTFLWRTLSAAVRSNGVIVINVASSGIASLLLPGGRTAHYRFGLPINVHESSTCSISQQSPQAELLIRAKLIIWDEAHMMHRYCFEALDKTMKSILQADKPFGGKSCSSPSNVDEIKEFGDWILNVGNGDVGEDNDGEASIKIPDDMLIGDSEDPFRDLLEFVYPDLLSNMYDRDYFQGRAILAPTNECIESVNDHLMSILPGEEKVYLSSDSMCRDEHTTEDNAEIYSTEFLNTIRCSGVPSHALRIKVGAPVMLIRNIDQVRGLCDGTRLQIIRTGIHVLSCKILSGKNIGDMVFIHRMTLIPSNCGLPIKFQRRQFPKIVSFAMTINKSQGQTLSHVGLYLPRPVFSHGQLYVAVSRVKSRGGIKIFIKSDSGELTNVTRNVVYKEVFHRI
ncbi:hypothetical protein ABFS83_12G026400 [Erythranthe nasuta]